MDVQPQPDAKERGSRLLVAHVRSLDPCAPRARRRLENRLGSELAGQLMFALAPRAADGRRAA